MAAKSEEFIEQGKEIVSPKKQKNRIKMKETEMIVITNQSL
jgi:hypothetical protein